MLDIVIFSAFMFITLVMGLSVTRGINSLKEYAIGHGAFRTSTLVATLVATWTSGAALPVLASETYNFGIFFFIPALGVPLAYLTLGYFFASRFKNFLGTFTIAEAIGKVYGEEPRMVTALVSIFYNICIIIIQFKISAAVLQLIFNIPDFEAVLLSAIVVTFYSAMGGINAVTITDIFQVMVFTFFICVAAFLGIKYFIYGDVNFSLESVNNKFTVSEILNTNNPNFWKYWSFAVIIPNFNPGLFQRILMARDEKQIRQLLVISGFCFLAIVLFCCFVGVLVYGENNALDTKPDSILSYIAQNYSPFGMKVFLVMAVMAAIMSTADSFINSTAVIIVQDMFLLKLNFENKVFAARITAVILGVICFVLSFFEDIVPLFYFCEQIYIPMVSVPLYAALFNVRMNGPQVVVGTLVGFMVVLVAKGKNVEFDLTLPGIIGSIIGLTFIHFFDKLLPSKTEAKTDEIKEAKGK